MSGDSRGEKRQRQFLASVAMPAYNGSGLIVEAMTSVVASVGLYHRESGRREPIALSVVDDASTDGTAEVVAEFARSAPIPVIFSRQEHNQGRASARNRAVAQASARYYFFLYQDDIYLPEHLPTCLLALEREPEADYAKTGARFSASVDPYWQRAIAASLTQNLCVRAYCHALIGGFLEDSEVELYGCDDVLYNRLLGAFLQPLTLSRETVFFRRRPGNSFDRQYERKLSRSPELAECTLSNAQLEVAPVVMSLYRRRLLEVQTRMRRMRRLTHSPRSASSPRGGLS